MKIAGVTQATVTSSGLNLTGYYTSSQVDTLLTSYYTSSQVDTLLTSYYTSTEIDTNHYTKTEIDANTYTQSQTDTLLTAKQDTTTGLTNLLSTALCQYNNHLTINEIQASEPSEALRVYGDTHLDGNLECTGTLTLNSVSISNNIFCGGALAGGAVLYYYTFGRVSFTYTRNAAGDYTITFAEAHPVGSAWFPYSLNSSEDQNGDLTYAYSDRDLTTSTDLYVKTVKFSSPSTLTQCNFSLIVYEWFFSVMYKYTTVKIMRSSISTLSLATHKL